MKEKLNSIRQPLYNISFKRKIINTLLIVFFGMIMGIVSKFLDCTPSNHLPVFLEKLDISNFLGRIAIWYLIALILSIYSKTPVRAAVNVFVFFAGMLTGYYAYTKIFAGFYTDRSYLMMWVGLTIVSPILAFVCWYAKGKGIVSLIISAFIAAVLFLQAFFFGLTYFDVAYQGLEVIVWIVCLAVLYKSPIQFAVLVCLSLLFAVLLRLIFPFGFFI